MFIKCSCIMNLSVWIMKIVIVWGWWSCKSVIPDSYRNIWDRCRRIPLLVSCVKWMFLRDNFTNKGWGTFFLCFWVSCTDSGISPHRDSFEYSLGEYSCNDRLFTIWSFFAYYDRRENEFLISIFSEFTILRSDNLIKLSEKFQCYLINICIRSYSIGIWIEKSFKTLLPF